MSRNALGQWAPADPAPSDDDTAPRPVTARDAARAEAAQIVRALDDLETVADRAGAGAQAGTAMNVRHYLQHRLVELLADPAADASRSDLLRSVATLSDYIAWMGSHGDTLPVLTGDVMPAKWSTPLGPEVTE